MMQFVVMCLLVSLHAYNVAAALSVDHNGYIVYCPCMGMFLFQTDNDRQTSSMVLSALGLLYFYSVTS